MSNFATAMRNTAHGTRTENGQYALNTTGDHLLDLYATIGAYRSTSQKKCFKEEINFITGDRSVYKPVTISDDGNRIETLFAEAWKEDPLLATKIVFYARDIREGLGERRTFRTLIKYMATHHPESLKNNIPLIGLYGRYDDLYELVDTPLETEMWRYVKKQLQQDINDMSEGKPVSLLAKWLKTADASSENTRKLGIYTAKKLGYRVYNYKRILRSLRKYIKVTEGLMSTKQWDKIEYSEVPSKAMHIYSNAFQRHDDERFEKYLESLSKGETKINASTLYPYELFEKYNNGYRITADIEDPVVEAQWKALPNYVTPGMNAIVMADVSGSMHGRPMATSVSLALYFAERNVGAYHGLWMSFSSDPHIHEVKGETLLQKIANMDMDDWGMSTDLEQAIQAILWIAIKNHVPSKELPKSLIVISDMEIDRADYGRYNGWGFYDIMKAQYAEHGYEIPNIIFWNVNSRHDVFHADSTRKGVQLVSGSSPTVFKHVMEMVGSTPIEAMLKVINSERYSMITLSDK